jgi:hypothetical protein
MKGKDIKEICKFLTGFIAGIGIMAVIGALICGCMI